jgi:hypothetical protein
MKTPSLTQLPAWQALDHDSSTTVMPAITGAEARMGFERLLKAVSIRQARFQEDMDRTLAGW